MKESRKRTVIYRRERIVRSESGERREREVIVIN